MKYTNIPPLNAAAVLKRYGLRADKALGQNFLQDNSVLEKIANAEEGWETECPEGVAAIIKERGMFGYKVNYLLE